MRSRLRRARSFLWEFIEGIKVAWDFAVMHDCEANGGHRWGPGDPDCLSMMGPHNVCTRCGCVRSKSPQPFQSSPITTTSNTHYTISY